MYISALRTNTATRIVPSRSQTFGSTNYEKPTRINTFLLESKWTTQIRLINAKLHTLKITKSEATTQGKQFYEGELENGAKITLDISKQHHPRLHPLLSGILSFFPFLATQYTQYQVSTNGRLLTYVACPIPLAKYHGNSGLVLPEPNKPISLATEYCITQFLKDLETKFKQLEPRLASNPN